MNQEVTPIDFDLCDVVSPEQLVAENPDTMNKGHLEWLLRNRERNGLSACGAVLKAGRGGKLKLIRPLFAKWYLSQKA